MSLTATIANRSASLYRDSLGITDKVNEQSDLTITVIDLTGTARYSKNMPITITDEIKGVIWRGYINNQPSAKVLYPNPARMWSLDCRDQTWLMSKRTSNHIYTNQFAGVILVDQIQRSDDGLTAAAALGWYELFTEWQNATLSGTLATTNAGSGNPGDGDLELALAGSTVTFAQSSQSDFNAGTVGGGLTATTDGVTFTGTPAIKLQATQNIPGLAKPYTYVKIWDRSVSSYTFPTSFPTLFYEVWVASDSPKQMAAIELVCTDGTSFQASLSLWNPDPRGMDGGIATDLAGLATNQWYSRNLPLYGFSSLGGKTLQYVAVAFGGTDQGTYTAYFRKIKIAQSDGTTNKLDVFSSSATAIPITPQQLQDSGYINMSCSFVTAYERHGFMYSPAFSLSAAGIARSSYVSWDITLPENISFSITATVDGFATFLPCTNNAAIPGLLPGANLSGKSLQFVYVFDSASSDPTLTPVLTRVAGAVMPAYAATKSDSITTTRTQSGWNAGSLTNLLATGGNTLQLNGFARDWSDANTGSQTLFGTAGVASGMNNQQFFVSLTGAGQGNSRLDFVGNWQNFKAEVDLKIETNGKAGIVYRTTNWSNADANYAYAVEVSLTGIALARGSNSSSGSAGTRTQIGSASFTLNSGDTHRLKVDISGSSHQISLDDVLFLNVTDSTYTAAGGISLRSAPSAAYTQIFDNFGVVASLSGTWVSPAIDIHALGTISNSQILIQIDPASSPTLCTFVPEISLNNGSTWATCQNALTGNTSPFIFVNSGYYQVLSVPGLSPGTNVSSLTQVKIRLTITTTTAATGLVMPDIQAITLSVLGSYSSSGTWSTAPLAWDSAQRSNVVGGFGTATNGATYTKSGTGGTNLTSNELLISATTGDVHMRIGALTAGDQEATVRINLDNSGDVGGLELRYVDAADFYRLAVSTSAIIIAKANGGSPITLASAAVSLAINTWYHLHFQVFGSAPVTLRGRVWADGTTEPNEWDVSVFD